MPVFNNCYWLWDAQALYQAKLLWCRDVFYVDADECLLDNWGELDAILLLLLHSAADTFEIDSGRGQKCQCLCIRICMHACMHACSAPVSWSRCECRSWCRPVFSLCCRMGSSRKCLKPKCGSLFFVWIWMLVRIPSSKQVMQIEFILTIKRLFMHIPLFNSSHTTNCSCNSRLNVCFHNR